MRAIHRVVWLGAVVLMRAAAASAQTAPSVDEIIGKCIAAGGGREALAKITSRSATGTMSLSTPGGDLSGTIEVLNEAPNKTRSLVKLDASAMGGGLIVVDERFDGSSGYVMDSMQGDSAITGSRLEYMRHAIFPSPFVDYKTRGTKVELAGKEKLGDRDVLALVMTPATGPPTRLLIDAATYLLAKLSVTVDVPQMGSVEQSFEFSDFRDVDGVKVAFGLNGMTGPVPFTIALTKVEHNVKIDPSLFVKPVDK
jgi:outer membrane lipoprotein-sorting protein